MTTNDTPNTLGDYVAILRRRRMYLLTIIPASVLLAVFLAYWLPPIYRSSATILLEPSSIPDQLVQTTVTSYADQQIELVQRRVMTTDKLEQLVGEIDPYPDMPQLSARDKARRVASDIEIERVDPITLEVLLSSNAFSVHYSNPDPELAALVAQRLADLFLSYNRETRRELASETYEFMRTQAENVEQRIKNLEQRIADFKTRSGDSLPETQARNQAALERTERDLRAAESQIRAAEERQALLNAQLSGLSPYLAGTAGNWRAELAELQAQLADARARYTPDHPDVKRLQRQIETLAAKVGAGTGAVEIVPDNPDYLAVQGQLRAVQLELSAQRSAAARARAQMADYDARLATAPAVEREYSELTRDRDVLRDQFNDIQNKLREADLARSVETAQKGSRFTQIRAPGVPDSPFSPNRLGIILLGLVLGAGLAAGLAALAESADPTVRSVRDLTELTSLPTVAAVPIIVNTADRRRQLAWWGSYAAVLAAATILVAATVILA